MSEFVPLFTPKVSEEDFQPSNKAAEDDDSSSFEPWLEPARHAAPEPPAPSVAGDDTDESSNTEEEVQEDSSFKEALLTALPEAPEDLELLLERLRQEAFQEGMEAAAVDYEPRLEDLRVQLALLRKECRLGEELLAGVEVFRRQVLFQAADDLSHLVLTMARRVIGDSLALHPEALPGVVSRALDRLPGEDAVTVRVRPQDVAVLESRVRTRRDVEIVGDPEITGGCVLEARFGSVDASFAAAEEGLTEAIDAWRQELGS